MRFVKMLFLGFTAITLLGCAHSINISPNMATAGRKSGSTSKIKANVGYYIPVDVSNIEITSPGGGGDSVRYFPYKDMETAYQLMLTNVFDSVVKLNSASDQKELLKDKIKYVLEPILLTTSGSTGFFTWAPTNFTVDLTTNIRDTSGKIVANQRVIGNGQVDFILDMHGDYGLAGRLAMEDALLKMQRTLLETDYNKVFVEVISPNSDHTNAPPIQPNDQISIRLEKLKDLLDKGLVNREEYEHKKKQILDSL